MTKNKINERQVGGDHYTSSYMHWDFIEEHGIGYLEAAATKYVCRWRKKGGRLDLEKALHYVDKLIELHRTRHRLPRGIAPQQAIARFCIVNQIPLEEAYIIQVLSQWSEHGELVIARSAIVNLLAGCEELRGHGPTTGMEHPFGYDHDEEVGDEK